MPFVIKILLFYYGILLPNDPENHNFQKEKKEKMPGNITLLYTCVP